MRSKVHSYSIIAFCSALIAVLAQITIPLPLIPITGQSLAIGLIATILPLQLSIMAVMLYILIVAALFIFLGISLISGQLKRVRHEGKFILEEYELNKA